MRIALSSLRIYPIHLLLLNWQRGWTPHTHANRSTHQVPPLSQLEHSCTVARKGRTEWRHQLLLFIIKIIAATCGVYAGGSKIFKNQNSKNYYTSTCLTPIGVLTCTLGAYWEGDEASLRSSTQRTVLLFFYFSLKKS